MTLSARSAGPSSGPADSPCGTVCMPSRQIRRRGFRGTAVAPGNLAALVAGAMTSDDAWCDRVLAAAGRAGEAVWKLPMFPEFGEQIRSEVADIKNTGDGRWGAPSRRPSFWKSLSAGGRGSISISPAPRSMKVPNRGSTAGAPASACERWWNSVAGMPRSSGNLPNVP